MPMAKNFDIPNRLPLSADTIPSWIDRLILWMIDMPPRQAWTWTVCTAVLLAIGDYETGPKVWFGPLYLLAICLTAGALGVRAGLVAGVATGALSIAINGANMYAEVGPAIAWNVSMRLLSVVTVVVLVGGFRRSLGRERLHARTDHLTGALTRHGFLDRVGTTVACTRREQRNAVLAYIDLDGFKQVNDRHGHAAGDAVLQAFARGVRATLLPADSFARIGGDEFLLFLPLTAVPITERIADLFHARLHPIVDRLPYPVTCSIGAVVLDISVSEVGEADIALADRLMYEVKKVGGNAMRIAIGNTHRMLGDCLRPPVQNLYACNVDRTRKHAIF